MFPAPPHWATSCPRGRSTEARLRNSDRWSVIQWNVAVDKIASTASVDGERLGQVGHDEFNPGLVREPDARLRDHRARPVQGDHPSAGQPLQEDRRDTARPAAGVEHALAAHRAPGDRRPRGPSGSAARRDVRRPWHPTRASCAEATERSAVLVLRSGVLEVRNDDLRETCFGDDDLIPPLRDDQRLPERRAPSGAIGTTPARTRTRGIRDNPDPCRAREPRGPSEERTTARDPEHDLALGEPDGT